MTNPFSLSFLVGIGGFTGSIIRYGLSLASQRFSIEWPLGTLAANVLGCMLLGIITGISARGETLSPELRLALATGLCGGFTTMSSMIYETTEMLRTSEYLHAAMYAVGTFFLSLCGFALGRIAIRILVKLGGGLLS